MWLERRLLGPGLFADMERMRRQMDRLYDELYRTPPTGKGAGVFPSVNLTESKEAYFIRAELPGVKSDALDIQVTGRNVSISGERTISAENARYHRKEREAGKFSRVIGLPGEIDSGKVEATLSDGILTLAIPKSEAAKPRQITVK